MTIYAILITTVKKISENVSEGAQMAVRLSGVWSAQEIVLAVNIIFIVVVFVNVHRRNVNILH